MIIFPIRSAERLPRCSPNRSLPGRLQVLRHQEGQFERLVCVQARVAVGVVAVARVVLDQRPGAAEAFGDVLARHLQVHAARVDAFGPAISTKPRTSVRIRSNGRVL